MKKQFKDECIFSVYKTKPDFMRDDEPKKRISKVIDRKNNDSDSFEDLEDGFEDLAQQTTNENQFPDLPEREDIGDKLEDSFEVIDSVDQQFDMPKQQKKKITQKSQSSIDPPSLKIESQDHATNRFTFEASTAKIGQE